MLLLEFQAQLVLFENNKIAILKTPVTNIIPKAIDSNFPIRRRDQKLNVDVPL